MVYPAQSHVHWKVQAAFGASDAPCATSLGCRNSKIAPDQYIWQTPLSSIDLEIPEEESAQVVLAKMMVDGESVLRRIAEADKSYKVPVSPV